MKNAYLFAIEIDEWGKSLAKETQLLLAENTSQQLLEILERIEKKLSSLALYITACMGDQEENNIINPLLKDLERLKETPQLMTASISNAQLTYDQMREQIQTLIDTYQIERQKPEIQDTDNIINQFNSITRVAEMQSSNKKTKSDLFKQTKETIISFKLE